MHMYVCMCVCVNVSVRMYASPHINSRDTNKRGIVLKPKYTASTEEKTFCDLKHATHHKHKKRQRRNRHLKLARTHQLRGQGLALFTTEGKHDGRLEMLLHNTLNYFQNIWRPFVSNASCALFACIHRCDHVREVFFEELCVFL